MCVVFREAGNDQPAVLPSVDIPAAPVRFMGLTLRRRGQILVDYLSVDKYFFFQGFNPPVSFLGVAKASRIIPAERFDSSGFPRKQNDGSKRGSPFLFRILWGAGQALFVDGNPGPFRGLDDPGWSAAAVRSHDGKTVLRARGWLD